MTFEQQLIITVVDKAIIGALLAVGAYILSRKLERFKSAQALSNEYAKQRLQKVADLWEVLHAWEAEAVELSHVFHRAIGFNLDGAPHALVFAPYAEQFTALKNRRAEVERRIELTRFWLGEELRARFLRYYQAIQNHLGNMSGDDLPSAVSDDAMRHLEKELAAVRQSIFAFIESTPGGQSPTPPN